MTTTRPLLDATLEAMLARRAALAGPVGMLDEIMAVVYETPQARRPLFARPGWGAPFSVSLRLAWVVATVALLLAVLAGVALIGARLLERSPAPLRYSGEIDTLTGGMDWWSARTDFDGNVWAYSPGHLVRVDAAGGAIRSWSVSDNEAFASAGIAPARAGGVWVIGKDTLRRFDGDGFRTVIDEPSLAAGGEIWSLAEVPDGGLWAALGELGPRRWDGAGWAEVRDSPPALFATFITVDATGRVWTGGIGGGVSMYDGTSWTTYPPSADAAASRQTIRFIADAPDGTIWVGTDGGVARLDGTSWTDVTSDVADAAGTSPAGSGVVSFAFGPDGDVWIGFLALVGEPEQAAYVARFDGRTWTAYGPTAGLPTGSFAAWVTTTASGVYLVASPGLFRLDGGLWQRVWPTAPEPGLVRSLLAVSPDEAWAAADNGVFRYRGDTWVLDAPGGSGTEANGCMLARAPDGALWAGGYHGLAVRGTDQWRIIGGIENGRPLAFARDGTLWVAESRYPADQIRIASLAPGGRVVPPERIEPSPLGWISSLAVGRDGTVWAGSDGFFAPEDVGLARFDGVLWERIRPLGAVDVAVTGIEAAPNGDVWVTLLDGRVAQFDGTAWVLFGEGDGLPTLPQGFNVNLAIGPDGTAWVGTHDGLARFDGQRWTTSHAGVEFGRLSVAPDGTVWVMGPSGVQRLRPTDVAP